MIIEVNPNKKNKICSPVIGFEAENKVTGFEFDYSDWAADIGDGYLTLSVKRPTDTIPYPVSLTQTGTHKATWTVSSTDVAFAGRGEVQLTYIVDDKVKKSAIYEILIDRSLEPDGDIPDPYISWFEELLQVSVQVEADADRAEAAADSIKNLEAVAVTLPSGESATAEYDPETGVMSFGIPKGDKGDTGETGATGNGISSTVLNADYTLTINFTDGTSYTTPSIRGEQGIQGETGNGIASTVLNPDYTLTITFTNGTTYTTPSIRGPEGAQGQPGPAGNGIDNVTMDASGYLTITFTDGSTWTSPTSLIGPVQDVKVNGESVVDENGVANITVPIITKTVSGNPIVLDDADGAVQALDVELLPKQDGTPSQDSTVYNEPYLTKSSPSYNSEYDKIIGGTVAWNQLLRNGDFSDGTSRWSAAQGSFSVSNGEATIVTTGTYGQISYVSISYVSGHKYLMTAYAKSADSLNISVGSAAMSTNHIYTLVSSSYTLVGSVYNCTNTGYTVVTVTTKNGGDNKTYTVKNVMCIDLTQMFGTTIADYIYSLEQATAGAGVAWFRKLFPKPYYAYNAGELMSTKPTAHVTSQTYPLAGVELRGIPKLDASNNLYYDGDTYESSGTVTRKYGIVDLGTLDWLYNSTTLLFRTGLTDGIKAENAGIHCVCQKYRAVVGYNPTGGINDTTQDKVISVGSSYESTNNNLLIRDTSYTDATAFKTAMSGVYLVYELATPTTETVTGFTSPQAVGSTESYTDTRAVPIPVGHESRYADIFPITGHDSVTVTDTGKNLLPVKAYTNIPYNPTAGTAVAPTEKPTQWTDNGDDTFTMTLSSWEQASFITPPLTAGKSTIRLTTVTAGMRIGIYVVNADNTINRISTIRNGSAANELFQVTTTLTEGQYFAVYVAGGSGSCTIKEPQCEYGETATSYAPYKSTTATVTLPHTVYGADVDVTGGEGKETYGYVDMGTLNWGYSGGFFRATNLTNFKRPSSNSAVVDAISSAYSAMSWNAIQRTSNGAFAVSAGSDNPIFCNTEYSDATAFKTAMNGVQLCYELATPTDLQTTPTDVELYKGDNVVSGDGNMTLTYVRNLQMVIDKIESAL